MAGLAGYVGVDLVLGAADDGGEDRTIEINPRLTTSYVGLRALAEANLAEVLVKVVRGEVVPAVAWRPGTVSFRADGRGCRAARVYARGAPSPLLGARGLLGGAASPLPGARCIVGLG